VNLRYLVPALGLAALSATSFAEDKAPTVSFNGWVDAITSYSTATDAEKDDTTTAKDENGDSLLFTSAASLKAHWNVTDKLSAHVNLWFKPEFNDVQMREAYFSWAINDTLTWSMGKYIDHVGWISADPTGLFTVKNSHIGYLSPYGNDVIGTNLAFAAKDVPVSGSFHVTNGYYSAEAATNDDSKVGRDNTDLGLGLDLIYTLPNEMGNINFDLAYDMHSDPGSNTTNPGNDYGGDVFLVGLNATVKPIKPLTIGAEIQLLSTDDGETATGGDIKNGSDRTQGLLLANYALEGTAIPMSVTGMIQYVSIDFNNTTASPESEERLGFSLALLTNPLTSSNFGLNYELGFYDISNEGGVKTTSGNVTDYDGIVVSVEGLVTF
jgi:hypothetical protein